MRPFLLVSNGRCGRWRDHRQVIDGILHRVRTGAQWRALPERFGPWKTVYERHRLWSADGTWEKTDSQAARLRKGSRGGRPPGFDEERYRKRNTVERAVNRLKQCRAVATRYDKRAYVYLGTTAAAALTVWLRA
ncbi:transposase [Streptomyces sp. NPDC101158]|uniref:transposase n=1 Tax=Streptomyces sp. NPDC101158 TaxID=3366117 RepID=UPI00382CE464